MLRCPSDQAKLFHDIRGTKGASKLVGQSIVQKYTGLAESSVGCEGGEAAGSAQSAGGGAGGKNLKEDRRWAHHLHRIGLCRCSSDGAPMTSGRLLGLPTVAPSPSLSDGTFGSAFMLCALPFRCLVADRAARADLISISVFAHHLES